jgi:hypothetical protein
MNHDICTAVYILQSWVLCAEEIIWARERLRNMELRKLNQQGLNSFLLLIGCCYHFNSGTLSRAENATRMREARLTYNISNKEPQRNTPLGRLNSRRKNKFI